MPPPEARHRRSHAAGATPPPDPRRRRSHAATGSTPPDPHRPRTLGIVNNSSSWFVTESCRNTCLVLHVAEIFNLQEISAEIREKTSHLPGVSIAIMGSIVTGLGDMADADFWYVGGTPRKIDLHIGKESGVGLSAVQPAWRLDNYGTMFAQPEG